MDMKSHGESMIAEDLRELTARQPFEPDLDAITRRGRQLRRRHFTLVSGGVAAIAALAVAAGTIYGQAGTQHRPTAAGNVSAAPVGSHVAELTARITSLMRTAQAAHPTEVDKVIAKSASGTTESIVTRSGLELQTTWDASGVKQRVVYTQLTGATSKNPETKVLDIDYAGRVATAQTISLSKTSSKPIPVTLYPDAYLPGSPGTKLAGTATVNGQPAYEFTIPGAYGFDCTVWVSKTDYLPLKEVAHQGATTYDYSWSFESAAVPAKPSIPAGFKHN
jgi:hypothetical protein